MTLDGARIVTGSFDSTARIWDAASGRELARLAGHEGVIIGVAATPDGARIVTGSDDKTARIWEAASGRELARLTGHDGPVWSVAVTPDGARIVTGSSDNTARIWKLFPSGQALVNEAKAAILRGLTPEGRERNSLAPEVPDWYYSMRKWPYDPASLMIAGKELLGAGKLDDARAKFAKAQEQDSSLSAEIEALLAERDAMAGAVR